jgi:hypothetical protein
MEQNLYSERLMMVIKMKSGDENPHKFPLNALYMNWCLTNWNHHAFNYSDHPGQCVSLLKITGKNELTPWSTALLQKL